MNTTLSEMPDQELIDSWSKAEKWLTAKMNSKNSEDQRLFLTGLKKIEKIEDELQRRKLKYGRNN